ncbi:sporulation-induced protein [Massospora cicadina]|nr:sporulation-induced protein [Massospora cicadina]
MLWSAQYENYPAFDRLLDNHAEEVEGCSLERLFTERGFLQELQLSERLQKFLARRPQLEKLIAYAFAEVGPELETCELDLLAGEGCPEVGAISLARAAYLSIEVLVSNSWAITQAIISDPAMLEQIVKAPLSRARPLECKVAERLGRVVGHLLSRGSVELGAYVRDEWEPIKRFLIPSLADAYMSDLMLRLWVVSCPHPATTSQRFAEDLVAHLSPTANGELTREAACRLLSDIATLPRATDSAQHQAEHVIHALMRPSLANRLVDCLIDPAQSQASASEILSLVITLLQWPLTDGVQDCLIPYREYILTLVHRANEIQSVANAVADAANLATVETSAGLCVPLGPFRLKVAEFWTQLLRVASRQRGEDLSADFSQLGLDAGGGLCEAVCRAFLRHEVLGWVVDLLHKYPWHNLFHNVAYELLHTMLTWLPPPPPARRLLLELFAGVRLVARLMEGHLKGSQAVGYLGHFVLIGDDILRFIGGLKASEEIYGPILESMRAQGWPAYLEEYHLPAQRRARGGEGDGSMFGEGCLERITAQGSYPEEDDDDLDEIDGYTPYGLEDTLELDIDLHYEDDDDKEMCLLPNSGGVQDAWIRTTREFYASPAGHDLIGGGPLEFDDAGSEPPTPASATNASPTFEGANPPSVPAMEASSSTLRRMTRGSASSSTLSESPRPPERQI